MSRAVPGRRRPDDRTLHHVTPAKGSSASSLAPVNRTVAAKLWRLHYDRGYFTRAELEAEVGPPRDRWGAAA